MERRVGKTLRQFEHLDIFVEAVGSLLPSPGQDRQTVRDVLFRRQQVGQIDVLRSIEHLDSKLFLVETAVQRLTQLFGRLMDKIRRCVDELIARKAGMAVVGVVAQGAQKGRFEPLGAVALHFIILGDAVRVAKIQLERFAAEQIGVIRDRLHRARAKHPEDLHRAARADLKLCQIGDEFAHPEHPLEFLLDAVGLVRRNTRDARQLCRVVGDDVQRVCAELVDDFFGGLGSDIGQGFAGEEGIDGLEVFRHVRLALLRMELSAIGRVVLVLAPADDADTGVQLPDDAADDRDDAAARHLEDHIAVVGVLVDDVLDRAFDLFQLLLFLHFLTAFF